MRNVIVIFLLMLAVPCVMAQEKLQNLTEGDVLVINKQQNMPFDHLDFPRANFIIKRGGIANYKSLDGMVVKVESPYTNAQGDQMAKLVPLAGDKFFNRFTTVSANLSKALENKELMPRNLRGQSLAKN